jgi:hypothetical protein
MWWKLMVGPISSQLRLVSGHAQLYTSRWATIEFLLALPVVHRFLLMTTLMMPSEKDIPCVSADNKENGHAQANPNS